MDGQSAFQLAFDFGTSKLVVVEPSAAQVSSDAGLLPFRQLDERLGVTKQLAACLTDRRHAGYIGHTFLEMVRMRMYGILADYADQNDHDLLRSDRGAIGDTESAGINRLGVGNERVLRERPSQSSRPRTVRWGW